MQMREVSAVTGLSRDTIRYYEKEGLIAAPVRSSNGYRHYDDAVVRQLQLIVRAKALGFRLNEIRGLLELLFQNSLTPAEMKQHLLSKRLEVTNKIALLENIRTEIDQALAGHCKDKDQLSRG